MITTWQRNIGIALALVSFGVAGEYTTITRLGKHGGVYDTEAAAMQKAVKNLHTTTRLALFATWLQCPLDERTTIVIAPLPSDPAGIEIQKSRLFERYFVQRQTRVNPASYTQCAQIDAEQIMKGAA